MRIAAGSMLKAVPEITIGSEGASRAMGASGHRGHNV
jgi:hypothetical protein